MCPRVDREKKHGKAWGLMLCFYLTSIAFAFVGGAVVPALLPDNGTISIDEIIVKSIFLRRRIYERVPLMTGAGTVMSTGKNPPHASD